MLGRRLQLPLLYGPLKRRHGAAQHTLPRRERLRLGKDSFVLQDSLPTCHVAIVDDVMTTGATALALLNLLKNRGAQQVDIWCATRAVAD